MKIPPSLVLLIILLSAACSFKLFGKAVEKSDKIKEKVKDVKQNKIQNAFNEVIDKKFHKFGHKNESHGFVPSQVKCKSRHPLDDGAPLTRSFVIFSPLLQSPRFKNATHVRKALNVSLQSSVRPTWRCQSHRRCATSPEPEARTVSAARQSRVMWRRIFQKRMASFAPKTQISWKIPSGTPRWSSRWWCTRSETTKRWEGQEILAQITFIRWFSGSLT